MTIDMFLEHGRSCAIPSTANSGTDYAAEVDAVDQTKWDQLLAEFSDANLYQSWAYGVTRWGRQQLSHLVLRRKGRAVAIAQLRIVHLAPLKLGLAYLRWGPVFIRRDGELDEEIASEMAKALHQEYVEKRKLHLRILPQGVQGSPRDEILNRAFHRYTREPFGDGDSYRTLILDLSPPLEQLRRTLDQKWRNQLNRAEKNGLTIVEGETDQEFDAAFSLFTEMWERKQFKQTSDIREFQRMQTLLPAGQRMRVFICEQEGQPVAFVIGTAMGDTGIYLFGATSDLGMQSKGSYLLQWRMIQWLKTQGVQRYNLGGINPEKNPGVYHFKRGLSGEDRLYLSPLTACTNPLSAFFAGFVMKARARVGAVARWARNSRR